MLKTLLMAAQMKTLTPTRTALGCSSGSECRHLCESIVVFLERFLNKHQIMIVEFSYLSYEITSLLAAVAIIYL